MSTPVTAPLLGAIAAIVRKDLRLFLSDRRALLLSLVMPIALGAFFGYLFGGSGKRETAPIPIAVVLQDQGEIARRVADGLRGDATLAVQELPLERARELVRKGKLQAAVVLPAGFGDAAGAALFGTGPKPEIALLYDPSQAAALSVARGMLAQHVMQAVSAEMMGGRAGTRFVDASLKSLEGAAATDPASADLVGLLRSVRKLQERPAATAQGSTSGGLSMPYTTRDEAIVSGPAYDGYAHAFAGMGVQFILFMGIDAGIGILLARRQGIWSRMLASPVSLTGLLAARAVSATLIAFGLLCAIFLAAFVLFRVTVAGSMAGFIGVGLAFSAMTAAFGLLVAAWGRTPEAARGLAIFATLIMVMLGGAWVPAFLFPQWLQTLTLAVPTRWAMDGLDAVTWRGLGLDAALPAIAVQCGFAMLFGALALWKFRRDARLGA